MFSSVSNSTLVCYYIKCLVKFSVYVVIYHLPLGFLMRRYLSTNNHGHR
jgi:hypothetical protein